MRVLFDGDLCQFESYSQSAVGKIVAYNFETAYFGCVFNMKSHTQTRIIVANAHDAQCFAGVIGEARHIKLSCSFFVCNKLICYGIPGFYGRIYSRLDSRYLLIGGWRAKKIIAL